MLVQCTRKLLDELKLEPEAPVGEAPLFSWHANLVKLNRRKSVVLTNDQNRYIIVLYGLKAKDLGNFTELVINAIRETFCYEQISESVIDQYLGTSPGIRYSKTKNPSMTARLRTACDTVQFYVDRVVEGPIIQAAVGASTPG